MACINPNDPSYQKILARVGNPILAEIEFDKTQQVLLQLPKEEQKVFSPQLIKLMKEFITQIGVDYKLVQNIVVNGVKYDANGVALIMQKLIQVA
jgi:hypothetical protein